MSALFYVLLIIGWIILIVILKWRKSRAKREAEQIMSVHPEIHVIQIGTSLYDVVHLTRSPSQQRQLFRCDCPPNINQINNEGFTLDENVGVYPSSHINEPPPSYEDAMEHYKNNDLTRPQTQQVSRPQQTEQIVTSLPPNVIS